MIKQLSINIAVINGARTNKWSASKPPTTGPVKRPICSMLKLAPANLPLVFLLTVSSIFARAAIPTATAASASINRAIIMVIAVVPNAYKVIAMISHNIPAIITFFRPMSSEILPMMGDAKISVNGTTAKRRLN